jgi:hypothetical protein
MNPEAESPTTKGTMLQSGSSITNNELRQNPPTTKGTML